MQDRYLRPHFAQHQQQTGMRPRRMEKKKIYIIYKGHGVFLSAVWYQKDGTSIISSWKLLEPTRPCFCLQGTKEVVASIFFYCFCAVARIGETKFMPLPTPWYPTLGLEGDVWKTYTQHMWRTNCPRPWMEDGYCLRHLWCSCIQDDLGSAEGCLSKGTFRRNYLCMCMVYT